MEADGAEDPLLAMTIEVEHRFAAPPDRVFAFLTDPGLTARLSPEVVEAAWVEEPVGPRARFRATNRRGGMEWTVTCHVLEWDPPYRFAWCVSDPSHPSSTWSYDLTPDEAGTLVRQRFRHGPGRSMVRHLVEQPDADVAQILTWREEMLRADMAGALAEADRLLGAD